MQFVGSEYQKRLQQADRILFDLDHFLRDKDMIVAHQFVFQARLELANAESNIREFLRSALEGK